MKFSLNWLQQHIDLSCSIEDLIKKIDEIGLEVESIEDQQRKYKNFVVAEIIAAEQHPNADSLRVCKVKTDTDTLNIVCGAANARAGIKVVLAKIGAIIPNGLFQIKKSKIRNVESGGMLCSAEELCLSDYSDGIIELDRDAVVGQPFSEYAKLDDVILEVALTPNRRRDCASVYGIARDLAAAGCGILKAIQIPNSDGEDSKIQVKIEAKEQCSQFNFFTCAGVDQKQLQLDDSALMGKIKDLHDNQLVNFSNFTMLNFGNPNHIYDLSKIVGDTVYVKLSVGGEEFIALGGKSYILPEGILIICDAKKVLCVAGVMGSELSKVDENTRDILVEVANFHSESVARAGQMLGITSDSKYRFESGIDLESVDKTIKWMRQFFPKASAIMQNYGQKHEYVQQLELDLAIVEKFLGIPLDDPEIYSILERLSFKPRAIAGRKFQLTVPSWKQGNIETCHEVIEDLLRMGLMERINLFDNHKPFIKGAQVARNMIDSISSNSHENIFNPRLIESSTGSKLRHELIGRGMNEVLTWSFYSEDLSMENNHISKYYLNTKSEEIELITITNPINNNFTSMRRTHIQNLVQILSTYPNNQEKSLSIFEIGNIYGRVLDKCQAVAISGLRAGDIFSNNIHNKARRWSFFDVREDLLSLLSAIGMSNRIIDYSYDSVVPQYYHPTRSIRVKLGNTVLGICGELHPTIISKFEIQHSQVAVFELFTNTFPSKSYKIQQAKPMQLNPHQKIIRDIAFIVDNNLQVGELLKSALSIKEKLIETIEAFDVYNGIEDGKKSVAIKLWIQPTYSTLTDEIISSIMERVIKSVTEKHNAKLRD